MSALVSGVPAAACCRRGKLFRLRRLRASGADYIASEIQGDEGGPLFARISELGGRRVVGNRIFVEERGIKVLFSLEYPASEPNPLHPSLLSIWAACCPYVCQTLNDSWTVHCWLRSHRKHCDDCFT